MGVRVLQVQPGVPDQRLSVQLDGLTFQLDLVWNERAGQWFLSVADGAGALFAGHGLALRTPVFYQYRLGERAPPGELWCVDTSDQEAEPGLADLGARVVLAYQEA